MQSTLSAARLKSHHHHGDDTREGDRGDELDGTAGTVGGVRLGGARGGGTTRGRGGSESINNDVSATNAGSVVVDDDRSTGDGIDSSESKLGVDVLNDREGTLDAVGSDKVAVLAGQVTNLARGQVLGVAWGRSNVGGVQVTSGGRAVVVGANEVDVNVVLVTGRENLLGRGQTPAGSDGDINALSDLLKVEKDIKAILLDVGLSSLELCSLGGGKAGDGEEGGDGLEVHGGVY
jgi:hypothetical protein